MKKYSELNGSLDKHLGRMAPILTNALKSLQAEKTLKQATYKRFREQVARTLEKVLELLSQRAYLSVPYEKRAKSDEEIFYKQPELHTWERCLAKYKGFPETPYQKEIIQILSDLLPFVREVEGLKEKIAGKTPKPEKEEGPYQEIPLSDPEEIKTLRRTLLDLLQEKHEEIVLGFQNHFQDIISQMSSFDTLSENKKYGLYMYPVTRFFYDMRIHKQGPDKFLYHITPKDNLEEKVKTLAKKGAEDIEQFFLHRAIEKLGPILSTKKGLDSILILSADADNRTLGCRLAVKFQDGSSFEVKHKAVYVWGENSPNGFYRFPTTFHNVILPDGSVMGKPSEERMHSIFAKA